MQPDLLLRKVAERPVGGLDPELDELQVVLEAGLRVDLVPALGQRRVIELNGQPGVDDGLVFLPHGVGAGVEQFLFGLVVVVGNPCAGAWGQRRDETLGEAGCLHAGLEVGDVRGHEVLPGVGQRTGDLGLRDALAVGEDPGGGVVVGVIELLPVPAVREGGQDDVARRGTVHLGVGPAVHVGRLQAAEPGEGVVPPGAVVDGAGHRVPVFAVVGDVDAQILLALDDVHHGGFQQVQELGRDAVGFLGLVRGDQLGRAGQGAGVGDPDVVGVLGVSSGTWGFLSIGPGGSTVCRSRRPLVARAVSGRVAAASTVQVPRPLGMVTLTQFHAGTAPQVEPAMCRKCAAGDAAVRARTPKRCR